MYICIYIVCVCVCDIFKVGCIEKYSQHERANRNFSFSMHFCVCSLNIVHRTDSSDYKVDVAVLDVPIFFLFDLNGLIF